MILTNEERITPQKEIADLLSGANRTAIADMLVLLDPVCIAKRADLPTNSNSRYGGLIHSELCRHKMLGFTDANCAKAVGIKPDTLREWFERYPQLRIDMDQAAALASSEVATMLFKLMNEKGMVGFNALRFFLATRTEEFREKSQVDVNNSGSIDIGVTVRSIYGLTRSETEELPAASETDALLSPPPLRDVDAAVIEPGCDPFEELL